MNKKEYKNLFKKVKCRLCGEVTSGKVSMVTHAVFFHNWDIKGCLALKEGKDLSQTKGVFKDN